MTKVCRPHSSFQLEEIVSNYGLVVLSKPHTDPYRTIYSSDILRKYEVVFKVVLLTSSFVQKNVYVINDETSLSALSSNRLRTAIRRGESVRFCMGDSIIEYIQEHNLYR